jgi:hypothetical protein
MQAVQAVEGYERYVLPAVAQLAIVEYPYEGYTYIPDRPPV